MDTDLSQTIPFAEQMESLAQAIHEGDANSVLEWRWERASAAEQDACRRRARAIMHAYDHGARTAEEFAGIIASIDWNVRGAGAQGRLRFKAENVVRWFEFRNKGYLINR